MSEHLCREDRDKVIGTIQIMCAYFCEFATDADLFALQGILSNQAAQLAHRLASMGEGMLAPEAGPSQDYGQERLSQRLMAANAAMQRIG